MVKSSFIFAAFHEVYFCNIFQQPAQPHVIERNRVQPPPPKTTAGNAVQPQPPIQINADVIEDTPSLANVVEDKVMMNNPTAMHESVYPVPERIRYNASFGQQLGYLHFCDEKY